MAAGTFPNIPTCLVHPKRAVTCVKEHVVREVGEENWRQKCELYLKDCEENHELNYDYLRKCVIDAYLTYRKKYYSHVQVSEQHSEKELEYD